MLNLIYWNINKNNDTTLITAIADIAIDNLHTLQQHSSTNEIIFCISEPGNINTQAILSILTSKTNIKWWSHRSSEKRFLVISSIPSNSIEFSKNEIAHSLPCVIYRAREGKPVSFDIWFVHLSSPAFAWSPEALSRDEAQFLREGIEDRELDKKPEGTVAIGDFNMEPFGQSMIATTALNATPCRFQANSGPTEIRKGSFIPYFYNPMWELLGSWSETCQPGTFYRSDKSLAIRWHIIDHILVRPPLIELIVPESLRIITRAGATALTKSNGKMTSISDHLPITITLSI